MENLKLNKTITIITVEGEMVTGKVTQIMGGKYGRFVLTDGEGYEYDCNNTNTLIRPQGSELRKMNTYVNKYKQSYKLNNELSKINTWEKRNELDVDYSDYKELSEKVEQIDEDLYTRGENMSESMFAFVIIEFQIDLCCDYYELTDNHPVVLA